MTETHDNLLPENKTAESGPVLTWIVCAICVVVHLGLSTGGAAESWESASKWGYYPPGAEWEGKYWGLVTSVFVHLEIWHLGFNLYWLWVLGGRLEKAIGIVKWLGFFLIAAIVSSGIQLAVSSVTGIGASGVVYAIFGFMWFSQNHFEGFKDVLPRQTILLFVIWLFVCLAATISKIWEVGNAAHISGLLFGALVAEAFVTKRQEYLAKFAGLIMIAASIVSLFWCPWSATWVSMKAYKAHASGDYSKAVSLYRRSLELGQDAVWVWTNLATAYKQMGDDARYEEALKTLEKLDEKAAQSVR